MISHDRDAFQLVSEHVCVLLSPRGVTDVHVYTPERVEARYGIPARLVPDFIGLKGDTSDDIPGVPGIGDKTAADLLVRFGSLEGIYANVDAVTGEKRRQTLIEHREDAERSKQLATIERDLAARRRPRHRRWPIRPTARRWASSSAASSSARCCAASTSSRRPCPGAALEREEHAVGARPAAMPPRSPRCSRTARRSAWPATAPGCSASRAARAALLIEERGGDAGAGRERPRRSSRTATSSSAARCARPASCRRSTPSSRRT